MDAGDVATWVGVGAAVLVGAGGWIVAGVANRRAKQANQLAAEANRHAEAAVAEAVEANRVAVAANHLAEESNSVSLLEAARRAEHHLAEWRVEWDRKSAVLTLTNDGPDVAFEVAVTVNGDDLDVPRRDVGEVARRVEVLFAFPELVEKRAEFNREAEVRYQGERSPGIIALPLYWREEPEVIVRWRSQLGRPHEQRLKLIAT